MYMTAYPLRTPFADNKQFNFSMFHRSVDGLFFDVPVLLRVVLDSPV